MQQARTRPRKENMYSAKDSPQVVYVTPSYRLVVIPKSKENPIVMASHGHRSKLAAQVLNNGWVCVPPVPFKQHRLQINQYQEVLNISGPAKKNTSGLTRYSNLSDQFLRMLTSC